MADNVTPFPQGVRHKNLKADAFEKYMKAEGLNFFRRQDVHDSFDTVIFMTALPAGASHKVVTAVITNNSMYLLVRVHLGTCPKGPARQTFLDYINQLNGHHAIVKYSVDRDDNVFLDVCVTSRDERFDPSGVRTSLDLLVFHLKEYYDDIARRLDKTSDQTNGFTM